MCLHHYPQAVEAKEGLDIQAESVTLARVTTQAFYRWEGVGGWACTPGAEGGSARTPGFAPICSLCNWHFYVRRGKP